jgi:hypothetical protein
MADEEPVGAADVRVQLCGRENSAASARFYSSKENREWCKEREISVNSAREGIKEEGQQQTTRPIPKLYGQVQEGHREETKVAR